jgi:silicon transporter
MGTSVWKGVQYAYSLALLIFSTIIVMALIFSENTKVASDVHPAFAFVLIWVALLWLSMVEGGQASLVGLPPIDRDLYKESHPITHQICEIAHKGDNLNRYLMGRQFMVLALVFTTNMCGGPLENADVLGLPSIVNKIFLDSGMAMFFMAAMIGQLAAQVNASRCMLDYINTHFMTFTLYVANAIEASGLLHASYLIQSILGLLGSPTESFEPPRTGMTFVLHWARVAMSVAILAFAFAVTLSALFQGKTTMWESVPSFAAVVLFFVFMSIVGMLEGMQIAFFAVAKMTPEERASRPWAKRTCDLLFKGSGRNLPGFMVGRQMCVTLCFFIIARVTTVKLEDGETNIFGVSNQLQEFFNTGLLGAIITTIVGSITWQLAASAFPLAFLSTPVTYVLLRICLLLEATGLCSGSWVIAKIHKSFAHFKFDEVYVGTAEERAANKHSDGDYNVKPGHMYPGVPVMPPTTEYRFTLDEIDTLQAELKEHKEEIEERIRQLENQRLRLMNGATSGKYDKTEDVESGSDS